MQQILRREIRDNLKFDGSPTTGNRYYTGFTYFNMECAGFHGSDKMIYVLEDADYHMAKIRNCLNPAYIINHSVPIAKASLFAKMAVIQWIAYFEVGVSRSIPVVLEPLSTKKIYGETSITVVRKSRDDRFGKKGDFIRATVHKITIHPYSDNMDRSQYYDIYLNLVHEKHHADTPEDAISTEQIRLLGLTGDSAKSEYEAYNHVRSHDYYKYASEFYQEHVENELDKYERLVRNG